MKIEVWCDSGANAFSCRKVKIDTAEAFGLTDEEWSDMSEEDRNELVKEIAWDRLDWGYKEF